MRSRRSLPLPNLITPESQRVHSIDTLLSRFQDVLGYLASQIKDTFSLDVGYDPADPVLGNLGFHFQTKGDRAESYFIDKDTPRLIPNIEPAFCFAASSIQVGSRDLLDVANVKNAANIFVFAREIGEDYSIVAILIEATDGAIVPFDVPSEMTIKIPFCTINSHAIPASIKFNDCEVAISEGFVNFIVSMKWNGSVLFTRGPHPSPSRVFFPVPASLPKVEFNVKSRSAPGPVIDLDAIADTTSIECATIPANAIVFSSEPDVNQGYLVSLTMKRDKSSIRSDFDTYFSSQIKSMMPIDEGTRRFLERVLHPEPGTAIEISNILLKPIIIFRPGATSFEVSYDLSIQAKAGKDDLEASNIGSNNYKLIRNGSPSNVEPPYTDHFQHVHYISPAGFSIVYKGERMSLDSDDFTPLALKALHIMLGSAGKTYSFMNPVSKQYTSILAEIDKDPRINQLASQGQFNPPFLTSEPLIPILVQSMSHVIDPELLFPASIKRSKSPIMFINITLYPGVHHITRFSGSKHYYCFTRDDGQQSPCYLLSEPIEDRPDSQEFLRAIENQGTPQPFSIRIRNPSFLIDANDRAPSAFKSKWVDIETINGTVATNADTLTLERLIRLLGTSIFDTDILSLAFNRIFDTAFNTYHDAIKKALAESFDSFATEFGMLRKKFFLELSDYITGFLHKVRFKNVEIGEKTNDGAKFFLFNAVIKPGFPIHHVMLHDAADNSTSHRVSHCIMAFSRTKSTGFYTIDLDILQPIPHQRFHRCCPTATTPASPVISITTTATYLDPDARTLQVDITLASGETIAFLPDHALINATSIPYADAALIDIIMSEESIAVLLHTDLHILTDGIELSVKRADGRVFSVADIANFRIYVNLLEKKGVGLKNKDEIVAAFAQSETDDIETIRFLFPRDVDSALVQNLLMYAFKGEELAKPTSSPTEQGQQPETHPIPGSDWTSCKLLTIKSTPSGSSKFHFYTIRTGDHLHVDRALIDTLRGDDHVAIMAVDPDTSAVIMQVERQQPGAGDSKLESSIREKEGKIEEMRRLKERLGKAQQDSPIAKRLDENIIKGLEIVNQLREALDKTAGVTKHNFKFTVDDKVNFVAKDGSIREEDIVAILPDFVPLESSWAVENYSDTIHTDFTTKFVKGDPATLATSTPTLLTRRKSAKTPVTAPSTTVAEPTAVTPKTSTKATDLAWARKKKRDLDEKARTTQDEGEKEIIKRQIEAIEQYSTQIRAGESPARPDLKTIASVPTSPVPPTMRGPVVTFKGIKMQEVVSAPTSIQGKKIYITGSVPGYTKETLQALVSKHGGTWKNGVSKQLEILVIANRPGEERIKQAQALNIPQMQLADFFKLIGETPPRKSVPYAPESTSKPESGTRFTMATKKVSKDVDFTVEKNQTAYIVTFTKRNGEPFTKTVTSVMRRLGILSQSDQVSRFMRLHFGDAIISVSLEKGDKNVVIWLDPSKTKQHGIDAVHAAIQPLLAGIDIDFATAEVA